ncbi:MAG TPA: hypothetical protein DCY14_14345 [Anaerolineae bacterium]|nr:hypothetical protein [Anaerolineae bacterium]HRJ57802.1 hypothetical protein [Anaerolineales bacterium]
MLPSLTSQTLPRQDLTPETIQEMFDVFNENFSQTSLDLFTRDLNNKNWVILIRDDEKNIVQGFSTLGIYETDYQGQCITAVYSGDTIIRRAYWGTPELPKKWIHTVLEKTANMPQPVYWLLISSGYKTYRFLTVFYKEFYPCYNQPTPPETQSLMNFLASQRYGDDFYPDLGVVRFKDGATPLREGVAEVTDERLSDPHIAHYIKVNPHHDQGDELVCLTRVHPDNFTPAGRRMAR